MKKLLLIGLLFLIGCKGCDLTGQGKPPMQLHLEWTDSNPTGIIDHFVVYRWGGSDTLNYTRVDSFQIVSAHLDTLYRIPIIVTWDWFKYGAKAVADQGQSIIAVTKFYSYGEFYPLSPISLRIIK